VVTSTPDASRNDSILIFDSGAGGLSILCEVRKKLPTTHFHYLMDTACFPYGDQVDSCLESRIPALCKAAVEQFDPTVLVLACNTASTLALPLLREALNIPVVGVVPAVRVAAVHCTDSGDTSFGLLATPATVKRSYTDNLISDFADGFEVHRFGSPLLVSLAERAISGEDISNELSEHLSPWLKKHPEMKVVVLGCTHYPLLRRELQSLWPDHHWIDSGEAIARQTDKILQAATGSGTSPEALTAIVPESSERHTSLHWTGNQEPHGVARYLTDCGEHIERMPFNWPKTE
jgi:glutamate racemase